MSFDAALIAELLALGAFAGFLAGLMGVGGGMLMVPFITFVLTRRGVESALAVKMAIATSMATIIFTSVSSLRAHHRRGAVRWDLARGMAPGIVMGSLLAGAGAFAVIKGSTLAVFFGLFVGTAATQMLLDRRPKASRQMPGVLGQSTVGAGIGFFSGLVGAGGAFISVPFMTWCNVPLQVAVGTSAALGFPIAVANTIGYIVAGWNLPAAVPGAVGYVVFPVLGIIALGSMTTAPLGARVAHAIELRHLKRIFAVMLYFLAGYMFWRGFNG